MTKVAKFVSNENKKVKNSLPTHLFVITTIACWCISQPAPYMMNKWTVKGRASAHFKASNAFTWIGLETPEINFSSKIVNFKAPQNQIFSIIELNCLFLILTKLLIVPMTHLYPPFTEKKTPSFWEDSSMMKVEQCLWWTLLWTNSQSLRSFRRKKPWISGHPSASLIYQSHRPFIFPEVSQVLQNIPRIGTLTVTWEVGLNPFTLIVGPSRKCYNLRDTDAVTFSIVSGPSLNPILPHCYPIIVSPCQ